MRLNILLKCNKNIGKNYMNYLLKYYQIFIEM